MVKKNPLKTATQVENTICEVSGSLYLTKKKSRLHEKNNRGFAQGENITQPHIQEGQIRLCEKALKEPTQFWKSDPWKDETKINLEQNEDELMIQSTPNLLYNRVEAV